MRGVIILSCVFLLIAIQLSSSSQFARSGETVPWGVERVHTNRLWDNNNDTTVDPGANAGQDASIAVIDSGVFYYTDAGGIHLHEDIGNIVYGLGFDGHSGVVEEVAAYDDWRYDGHGTHVTGIVAALDNDIGVIGNAPQVYLYVLSMRTGRLNELVAAINWAVAYGIKTISISWAFWDDPDLSRACENAVAYPNDTLIFAGSGNDGNTSIAYPAAYPSVVAVGATCPNDSRCEFSNYGPNLDFVAPGFDINSTLPYDLGKYGNI